MRNTRVVPLQNYFFVRATLSTFLSSSCSPNMKHGHFSVAGVYVSFIKIKSVGSRFYSTNRKAIQYKFQVGNASQTFNFFYSSNISYERYERMMKDF